MEYSAELLLQLYRSMVLIRTCEESFVEPILSGELRCPCHLYSGQEAVAAGLCSVLRDTDYIWGNHRSHGHYLAKGGDLKRLVSEIYCRDTGCSLGRGGSMHLADPEVGMLGAAPVVAGTISLALGSALASSIQDDGRITVSFFGDGATGEGVLYECLNFAALKKLPIIFACENNLYATHMPVSECRIDKPISSIAEPFGIESHQVNGNDVLEVRNRAQQAVGKCRSGNGPVFLEFLTYRYRGHVGPDDNIQGTHTDIRPYEEIARWLADDPIEKLRKYIITNAQSDGEIFKRIEEDVKEQVKAAHRYAVSSPYPKTEELEQYVFAKNPTL